MASPDLWPSVSYAHWSETCDTLHGHTQVLGKLAATLAPPEPQLQHAALVLADFRAPFRGRSSPVNAWWGSFDLAVNLFSGLPADPPADDFITRNSMNSQDVAVGWWPGDPKMEKAAFYGYAHPAPAGFEDGDLFPASARWDGELGLYLLDWEDVRASDDPHRFALGFARSVFQHACLVCGWDQTLAASAEGAPHPIA